jgi:hypothetical protein
METTPKNRKARVKIAAKSTKLVRVMTPIEYADLKGISLQCVCRALRRGNLSSKSLKGVVGYSKHSRFYLLEVNTLVAALR